MRDQANDIIVKLLYEGSDIKQLIKTIRPVDLQDDLLSELSIILLEKKPEFILRLHQDKQLIFYTIKIIKILAFSKRSYFFKHYRIQTSELTDEITDSMPVDNSQIEEEEYIKYMHKKIIAELDKIHWYYAKMVNFYIEFGDYRNMSKELNIPHTSCFKDVKKGINEIKSKLNGTNNKI